MEAKLDSLKSDELAGLKSDLASLRLRNAALCDHLRLDSAILYASR